jgi:hypothetical protein
VYGKVPSVAACIDDVGALNEAAGTHETVVVSHWGLLAMATPGSEAPSVGAAAPPLEDALGSKRSEADRKRQREYQAAHLKKKKEEAEEAARELTVLRRGCSLRGVWSAL